MEAFTLERVIAIHLTGNNIGNEGRRMISEVLKDNASQTVLFWTSDGRKAT